jgi:hypothetical protein
MKEVRDAAVAEAIALMDGFANRTGLEGDRPPRRYLWTDAFAVCNWIGLGEATGEGRHLDLALRLVDQVHRVLGRHRPDDSRRGWISGLPEAEGELHPTRGGLRIGKPLPERPAGERYDARLEWDRDGQYFHYLTKWMHALAQVAGASSDAQYLTWARELAAAAHAAFVLADEPGGPRMVWKTSIDLSRPLVPSMGQHDPLDGYVTALELEAAARDREIDPEAPDLLPEIRSFAVLVRGTNPRTADPLGIGGLLTDAHRMTQLVRRGVLADGALVATLLEAAEAGLARYAASGEWRGPADARLGFRELGLAIGLSAVERMQRERERDEERIDERLADLSRYAPLGSSIESFWLDPGSRRAATWTAHADISDVMLATRLAPEGYLVLR